MSKILVCLDGRIGFGGTFIAYWNLYHDLIAEHEIDFLTFRGEKYENEPKILEQLAEKGSVVHEIIRGTPIKQQYRMIKQLLSDHQYDVIHINSSAILYFLIPLQAACKLKIPVRVVHAHSNGEIKSPAKRWIMNTLLKPYIGRNATHFLACSEEAGNVKFTEKVFSKKGIVLNNAIDVDRFAGAAVHREEARTALGVKSGQLLLGSIGRCEPEKNQVFLIDVLAELLNGGRDAKLLLVGEGSQRQRCIDRAAELKVSDRVIFLNNQPNVEYWLSAMDLFLFPSFYEGFGIAALEAQATDLPVICSHGISRKVNVTGGVVFMDEHAAAGKWAEQVSLSLASKPQNNGEKIKKAGYDIHSSAQLLMNIYNSGVNQK